MFLKRSSGAAAAAGFVALALNPAISAFSPQPRPVPQGHCPPLKPSSDSSRAFRSVGVHRENLTFAKTLMKRFNKAKDYDSVDTNLVLGGGGGRTNLVPD
jgi:hypothetical protein